MLLLVVITAFLLGLAAQYSGLCLVAAMARTLKKKPTLLLSLLSIGFIVGTLRPLYLINGIEYPFYVVGQSLTVVIIGGIIFGMASVLNGGCALGTLVRLSRGDLRMFITGIGWVLGIMLFRELDILHPTKLSANEGSTFQKAIISFTILLGIIIIILRFTKEYSILAKVYVFGIFASALFLLEPNWSPSTFLYDLTLYIFSWGEVPSITRVAAIVMIIFGMVFFSILAKTFSIILPSIWDIKHIFLGMLMGYSASLMLGGNDSHILLVFPTLQANGALPITMICLGMLITFVIKDPNRF